MSATTEETSADTFWPGYVDAVTNLVLNLLFVVLIMTVAVFVLALEMGRQQVVKATTVTTDNSTPPAPPARVADRATEREQATQELESLRSQIAALKTKEAQLQSMETKLKALARDASTQATQSPKTSPDQEDRQTTSSDNRGGSSEVTTIVSATSTPRIPEKSLDKLVPTGAGGSILVKFADDAIALTREETAQLRSALSSVLSSGGAKVEVVVPTGFSEAKRLGFYRVMAVRNQLIELKVPSKNIEVSVREGSLGSDSSRVMVSPR